MLVSRARTKTALTHIKTAHKPARSIRSDKKDLLRLLILFSVCVCVCVECTSLQNTRWRLSGMCHTLLLVFIFLDPAPGSIIPYRHVFLVAPTCFCKIFLTSASRLRAWCFAACEVCLLLKPKNEITLWMYTERDTDTRSDLQNQDRVMNVYTCLNLPFYRNCAAIFFRIGYCQCRWRFSSNQSNHRERWVCVNVFIFSSSIFVASVCFVAQKCVQSDILLCDTGNEDQHWRNEWSGERERGERNGRYNKPTWWEFRRCLFVTTTCGDGGGDTWDIVAVEMCSFWVHVCGRHSTLFFLKRANKMAIKFSFAERGIFRSSCEWCKLSERVTVNFVLSCFSWRGRYLMQNRTFVDGNLSAFALNGIYVWIHGILWHAFEVDEK